MKIEPLQKEHIAALMPLEKACFGESAWSEEGFLSELSNDSSVCFCAVKNGEVLGCIAMNRADTQGFISKVMTHPNYRRQGVAGALLKKLTDFALESGMRELTLEVRESNTAAIALYTASGFENLGKRRNFYRNPKEDAVIMTKYL